LLGTTGYLVRTGLESFPGVPGYSASRAEHFLGAVSAAFEPVSEEVQTGLCDLRASKLEKEPKISLFLENEVPVSRILTGNFLRRIRENNATSQGNRLEARCPL
jgi:hypothetical protein